MPRIAGVDVPAEKVTWVALTAIHGIGRTSALAICKEAQIDPNGRMRDLSEDEVGHVATILDRSYVIEGALRRQMAGRVGSDARHKSFAVNRRHQHQHKLQRRPELVGGYGLRVGLGRVGLVVSQRLVRVLLACSGRARCQGGRDLHHTFAEALWVAVLQAVQRCPHFIQRLEQSDLAPVHRGP